MLVVWEGTFGPPSYSHSPHDGAFLWITLEMLKKKKKKGNIGLVYSYEL